MAPLQYNTFTTEEGTDYVTFIGPNGPRVTNDSHRNFQEIVRLLSLSKSDPLADVDPYHIDELFDVEGLLARKFERLSERVLIRNGQIYFDGEVVNNTLTEQVLRFVEDGEQDYAPLVNFWENLAANPQADARERAYDWLAAEKFTIDDDGWVVCYKAVDRQLDSNPEDPIFQSKSSGPAIVDDMEHEGGPVPQCEGSVVEIARGQVTHDPRRDCAFGLHVGTYNYASTFQSYSRGHTVLEVRVNPRDIVSVPNGDANKMRVCRYTVVGPVTEKYDANVLSTPKPEPRVYEDPYTPGAYDNAAAAAQAAVEAEDPDGITQEELATAPEATTFDQVATAALNPEPAVENTTEDPMVVHPTKGAFEKMIGRAKRRRRNFGKYATKHGPWTYIGPEGGDEKDRLNWSV